jgi:hypothetical protein
MERESILYVLDSFDRELNSYVSVIAVDTSDDSILFESKFGIQVKSKRCLGLASLVISLGMLAQVPKKFDIVKVVTNNETSNKILNGVINPNRLRYSKLIHQLVKLLSMNTVIQSNSADTDIIDKCVNNLIEMDFIQLPSVEETYGLHRKIG